MKKGEIKSFIYNGVRYFSENDTAFLVIKDMLDGWKLIPNIKVDNTTLSLIEKFIKENIPDFIEKKNNMEGLDNGVVLKNYIDPKPVKDYLKNINLKNFEVRFYTDQFNYGTKTYCTLILIDKRKDFENSVIKIGIEGGFFDEYNFGVENTFISIFYNNVKSKDRSFAVFNNLSHVTSEVFFFIFI